MLLLTGYTLEHVTCGIFKAAPHNVVSTARHAYMRASHADVCLLGVKSYCGMVAIGFPLCFLLSRSNLS